MILWMLGALTLAGATEPLSYDSTINQGLNKYRRINLNEERLQEIKGRIDKLQSEIEQLKARVTELETPPKKPAP